MPLDPDTFARLYASQAGHMLRFFMRRTFDADVSVDLVAETFAGGFASRRRFRGTSDEDALAWLYAIARNRLTDYLRRGTVEHKALSRVGYERRSLTDSEYERVEALAGLSELRATLGVALQRLSPEHRAALQLRVVEERSYDQVAVALGVNQQTARARVSRALSVLRHMPAVQALQEGQ